MKTTRTPTLSDEIKGPQVIEGGFVCQARFHNVPCIFHLPDGFVEAREIDKQPYAKLW